MKLSEIQDLIKFVSRAGVNEVEIEQKDFKIVIKADPERKRRGRTQAIEVPIVQQVQAPPPAQALPVVAPPVQAPAATHPEPTPPPAPAPQESEEDKYITVKSPMIGTFYRSAGPDKDAFVNVGDDIQEGKTICIIEAMKLFNEIEAEVSGKIMKVLVDDATPVQYDQPLFLVDPS